MQLTLVYLTHKICSQPGRPKNTHESREGQPVFRARLTITRGRRIKQSRHRRKNFPVCGGREKDF